MKIYRIADLFAGIGGMRLGFERTKRIRTVVSIEIDRHCCKTYEVNFGENPFGDITKIDLKDLPDFDILLAGFPCQAFSIAGNRRGFDDSRGLLFFRVADIIRDKKPMAFLLENVKGLTNHKGGQTLKEILHTLTDELGYHVQYQVLNAKDYGLPQNRERVYIAGFRDSNVSFKFPVYNGPHKTIRDILEGKPVPEKYYLSERYLDSLRRHKQRHKSRGNGFGYSILDLDGISNAVIVGGMGRERNLIVDTRIEHLSPDKNKEFIRTLTSREWARLQGFPDSFKIPVSDTQAYKQFGNSVPVNVIYYIAKEMIRALDCNTM